MTKRYLTASSPRKRRALPLIEAERLRVRALPAVRLLAGRFNLPLATAVAHVEAFGMFSGADR